MRAMVSARFANQRGDRDQLKAGLAQAVITSGSASRAAAIAASVVHEHYVALALLACSITRWAITAGRRRHGGRRRAGSPSRAVDARAHQDVSHVLGDGRYCTSSADSGW